MQDASSSGRAWFTLFAVSGQQVVQRGLSIHLNDRLLGGARLGSVSLLSPDADPVQLSVKSRDGGMDITIPELRIWGLLVVEVE